MWLINIDETYFAKMIFVDSKWPNLNAPGSYTFCYHPFLASIVGCPILRMTVTASPRAPTLPSMQEMGSL